MITSRLNLWLISHMSEVCVGDLGASRVKGGSCSQT